MVVFKRIFQGLYFVCLVLSRVFFFIPKLFFLLLKKVFKTHNFDSIISHFSKRQNQPEFILLIFVYVIAGWAVIKNFYVVPIEIVNTEEYISTEDNIVEEDIILDEPEKITTNLYQHYGNFSLNKINFKSLRQTNSDFVVWLSVDGTNINYPVVQTDNNDFYLTHDFDKINSVGGWPFMDYRNSFDMSDYNTVFYGHNMLNKTSFGSFSNVFGQAWRENSNHIIVVLTKEKKYFYKIFSAYYISPEVYYLKTKFSSDNEYKKFIETIQKRSIIDLNVDVSSRDKIITLSTCTDDNTGRKVIHAKLISSVNR